MTSRRIAVIGGSKFDQRALDSFLFKLFEKYPDATIVTGDGRGAEKHAYDSAATLGFAVERPPLHPEWFGKESMMCQVGAVMGGDIELYKDENWVTQSRQLTPPANIILLVGAGSRVNRALEIHHRINMHRRDARGALLKKDGKWISQRDEPRPLFQIAEEAAPPKTKPKRAVKKQEQLAA